MGDPYAALPEGCDDYGSGCQCGICLTREVAANRPLSGLNAWLPKPSAPPPYYFGIQRNRTAHLRTSLPWEPLAGVTMVPTANVQSGYHCKKCNCRNEYAGPEHLNKDGVYICYECK